MQTVTAASNGIAAKSSASISLPGCSNTAIRVPGQCGIPGCAYVLVADGCPDLCSTNYCNCGGIAAPLITTTISGSVTQNCTYSTQPTSNDCSSNSISRTLTTSATSSAVLDFVFSYITVEVAGACPHNHCGCGDGFIAEPFTAVVSGSLTENCAYPTQPASWACPTCLPIYNCNRWCFTNTNLIVPLHHMHWRPRSDHRCCSQMPI